MSLFIPRTDFFKKTRLHLWALIILWAIIQWIAYLKLGIKAPVDTKLYLEGAADILMMKWPAGHDFYYSSYMVVLAGIIGIGLAPAYMVVLQLIASVISVFYLYKLALHVSSKPVIAVITCLLYVSWFKFQQWNLILYTDSLFVSFTILSLYFVFTAKTKLQHLLAILFVCFTVFIRPTGICFLISIIGYWTYGAIKEKENPLMKGLVAGGMVLLVLIGLNQVLENFVDSFISSYSQAEIIYPKISLGVEAPGDLYIPEIHLPPIIRLLQFIILNPVYSIKLWLIKGFLFVGHIKPYYSITHNIVIGFFLYPLYLLAIAGFSTFEKGNVRFCISLFIGLQIITVSLTSENWDGRFILSLLPWIFLFSAFGIQKLMTK